MTLNFINLYNSILITVHFCICYVLACDFQCGDASNTCIRSEHVCDGSHHCRNWQDERNCGE